MEDRYREKRAEGRRLEGESPRQDERVDEMDVVNKEEWEPAKEGEWGKSDRSSGASQRVRYLDTYLVPSTYLSTRIPEPRLQVRTDEVSTGASLRQDARRGYSDRSIRPGGTRLGLSAARIGRRGLALSPRAN